MPSPATAILFRRKKRTAFDNRRAAEPCRAGQSEHMKTETLTARPAKSRKVVVEPIDGQAPIAIKKILAPTDFSPASKKALEYALRFAGESHSEITLLHILESVVPLTFEGISMPAPAPETESSEAEESLKALVASARRRGGSKVRATFRRGIASHEIVEAAKELDVDLIVMATHGYTGWKHFAIGSTAERVVRAAPCPVLVVREKEHDFL
jgi:universal stress protein A